VGRGGYVAAIRAGSVGFESGDCREGQTPGRHLYFARLHPDQTTAAVGATCTKQMQHAADFGVQASGIQLAFADVQNVRQSRVKNSKGIEFLMKKNKCTVFKARESWLCRARSKLRRRRQPTNHRDQKHHHRHWFSRAADSWIRN